MKLALTNNEVFFPGSYFVADLQGQTAAPEADMVSGYEEAATWEVPAGVHVATIALFVAVSFGLLGLVEALIA